MSDQGVSVVGQFRHFPRAPFTARYAAWFFVSCAKFVWWKHHGYFYKGWTDYEIHRYPPYWDDQRDLKFLKRYWLLDGESLPSARRQSRCAGQKNTEEDGSEA